MKLLGRMNGAKGLVTYTGPNLQRFQALTKQHDGKLVMTIFENVDDRQPRKMLAYFRLSVLPRVCEIVGEHRPMMMERYLLDFFGVPNKPLDTYTFAQLNYFIDAIENYFEL
jgi:hypothetical protein